MRVFRRSPRRPKIKTSINLVLENWEWAVQRGNIRNLSAFVDERITEEKLARELKGKKDDL